MADAQLRQLRTAVPPISPKRWWGWITPNQMFRKSPMQTGVARVGVIRGKKAHFFLYSFSGLDFCGGVMSRASELLELPGTVAASVYSRKGFIEEFEGALSEAEAGEMVHLCAAITLTMEMQGLLLGRMVDQSGWDSCYGWMTWGPEISIVTIHDSTCIVQGQQASFNQLIKAMRKSANTEIIKPGGKGEPNDNIG